MSHRGFIFIGLVLVLALPILYFRFIAKKTDASLDELLAERFTKRAGCPVDAVPQPGNKTAIACLEAYDGTLPGGGQCSILVGTQMQGTIRSTGLLTDVKIKVVGVYVPPQAAISDAWVAGWRGKAESQREDVIAAARTPDGGGAIVWKGLWSRDLVQAHLAQVERSLVQP